MGKKLDYRNTDLKLQIWLKAQHAHNSQHSGGWRLELEGHGLSAVIITEEGADVILDAWMQFFSST